MTTPLPTPTAVHKLALDRLLRLTAHEGIVEALEFYDDLPADQRRLVFAMLARTSAAVVFPDPPETSPVWTDDELRRCHTLHAHGVRSDWVVRGHRIYQRNAARRARDAERARAERPGRGKGPNYKMPRWTALEDAQIMAPNRKPGSDAELAARINRTVGAIHSRRRLLRQREAVSSDQAAS